MVICNESNPLQGKGFTAVEYGVPVVSDGEFMANVTHVIGGTGVEKFADTTADGDQFACSERVTVAIRPGVGQAGWVRNQLSALAFSASNSG
jgi:hypothetical protein